MTTALTSTVLLQNKHAVIFGAGDGIGTATAKELAAQGATVFLSGRRPAAVERMTAEIHRGGGVAYAAEVDALIGVPKSVGAFAPGQEKAPQALRTAGLVERIGRAHHFAQNLDTVVAVVRETASRVREMLARGRVPLAMGGDCSCGRASCSSRLAHEWRCAHCGRVRSGGRPPSATSTRSSHKRSPSRGPNAGAALGVRFRVRFRQYPRASAARFQPAAGAGGRRAAQGTRPGAR